MSESACCASGPGLAAGHGIQLCREGKGQRSQPESAVDLKKETATVLGAAEQRTQPYGAEGFSESDTVETAA